MPTPKFLSGHFLFSRYAAGSTPTDKGSVSWVNVGGILDLTLDNENEIREIFKGYPGVQRRVDSLPIRHAFNATFTLQDIGPIFYEVLFNTLALSSSGAVQFNPNEGTGLAGWGKFELYDSTNTLELVIDHYGRLAPNGPWKMNDLSLLPVKFIGHDSLLNSASVTSMS